MRSVRAFSRLALGLLLTVGGHVWAQDGDSPPAPPVECEDKHSQCEDWAETGECDKNAGFMAGECPEACRICQAPTEAPVNDPLLGRERLVLTTDFGDIVLGFYPSVAPVTVAHITRLARMGGYTTNEFFRVDKGFVLQVQAVAHGRRAKSSKALRAEAAKTVPDEFSSLRHERGVVSLGKFAEPHTGTSSFFILLGPAPSLDNRYTIFGRMVSGDRVLSKMEALPTVREGIFVKPRKRVEISSAVMMVATNDGNLTVPDVADVSEYTRGNYGITPEGSLLSSSNASQGGSLDGQECPDKRFYRQACFMCTVAGVLLGALIANYRSRSAQSQSILKSV